VGSGAYHYAKYLEYDSKEAWNHSFKWYLLPSLEHYDKHLVLKPLRTLIKS
ncbi:hypothetical protein ARMGADRAFT_911270, partial [Armillaria gallica]